MLIVGVLLATVALRFAMVAALVYFVLPRGGTCPACRGAMLPIRSPLLDVWPRLVERRWCLGCGWHGLVRRVPAPPPSPDRVDRAAPRSPSRPVTPV